MTIAQTSVAKPYRSAGRASAFSGREQLGENRRNNLIMLTSQRGTKNRLAQLAGTSGSRISLMTSARKPVSDVFAFAIEDGLKLARGWLDAAHEPNAVPSHVWEALQPDANTSTDAAASPRAPSAPRASKPKNGSAVQHPNIVDKILNPTRSMAPAANFNGIFDKPAGKVGPIAEALAKTILHLSEADVLNEQKAFQMLGQLISETSDQR